MNWSDALSDYIIGHSDAGLSRDDGNNTGGLPQCVVIDSDFIWRDDAPLEFAGTGP
jgi:isoamylase